MLWKPYAYGVLTCWGDDLSFKPINEVSNIYWNNELLRQNNRNGLLNYWGMTMRFSTGQVVKILLRMHSLVDLTVPLLTTCSCHSLISGRKLNKQPQEMTIWLLLATWLKRNQRGPLLNEMD
jgi:hypothetical protein